MKNLLLCKLFADYTHMEFLQWEKMEAGSDVTSLQRIVNSCGLKSGANFSLYYTAQVTSSSIILPSPNTNPLDHSKPVYFCPFAISRTTLSRVRSPNYHHRVCPSSRHTQDLSQRNRSMQPTLVQFLAPHMVN